MAITKAQIVTALTERRESTWIHGLGGPITFGQHDPDIQRLIKSVTNKGPAELDNLDEWDQWLWKVERRIKWGTEGLM